MADLDQMMAKSDDSAKMTGSKTASPSRGCLRRLRRRCAPPARYLRRLRRRFFFFFCFCRSVKKVPGEGAISGSHWHWLVSRHKPYEPVRKQLALCGHHDDPVRQHAAQPAPSAHRTSIGHRKSRLTASNHASVAFLFDRSSEGQLAAGQWWSRRASRTSPISLF